MQDLVKKVLVNGSPKSAARDKQALIKGLESIAPKKRKEIVLNLTKQLQLMEVESAQRFTPKKVKKVVKPAGNEESPRREANGPSEGRPARVAK